MTPPVTHGIKVDLEGPAHDALQGQLTVIPASFLLAVGFERARAGGQTVAGVLAALEESPGSMGRLPGNTWAPALPVTDSATESRPPAFDVAGKGEMVG